MIDICFHFAKQMIELSSAKSRCFAHLGWCYVASTSLGRRWERRRAINTHPTPSHHARFRKLRVSIAVRLAFNSKNNKRRNGFEWKTRPRGFSRAGKATGVASTDTRSLGNIWTTRRKSMWFFTAILTRTINRFSFLLRRAHPFIF